MEYNNKEKEWQDCRVTRYQVKREIALPLAQRDNPENVNCIFQRERYMGTITLPKEELRFSKDMDKLGFAPALKNR